MRLSQSVGACVFTLRQNQQIYIDHLLLSLCPFSVVTLSVAQTTIAYLARKRKTYFANDVPEARSPDNHLCT